MKIAAITCSRKYDEIQREYAWFGWILPAVSSTEHQVIFGVGSTAGRIDVDRSQFIHDARKSKLDWLIMRDTDVLAEIPFGRYLQLLEEDRRNGFDCVISPLSSAKMRVMAYPGPHGELNRREPFAIEAGSAGLMALSKHALESLEQLGEFCDEEGHRTPAYCMMNLPNGNGDPMTEDISLFANLKKGGIHSCADPRILVRHFKLEWGIPSYRPAEDQKITMELDR
jgi:hypothetical protein